MLNEDGRRYEVRSAGHSRRLYTNGVLHSQFNLKAGVSRSIWDLMAAPSIFMDYEKASALALGVGGGAAIRTLQILKPSWSIQGVDLDPIHNDVAKAYFGLCDSQVNLITADALQWVPSQPDHQFTFILDDLFSDTGGEVERAFPLSEHWLEQLQRLLNPQHFVLAINTVQPEDVKTFQGFFKRHLNKCFMLTMQGYSNRILVSTSLDVSARMLGEQMRSRKEFKGLRFRIRSL